MKFSKSYLIFLIIIFFAAGGLGILVYSSNVTRADSNLSDFSIIEGQKSQFRFLYGSFNGDHATYTFQTPPEEKIYADDCIGCKQEVGNAVIFAEFGCPEKAQYLFKSNSKRDVIEKSDKLDKNGIKIGEKRLIVFKNGAQITAARIFWIEGNDFWAIQAPTVEATKALEKSKEYDSVREKVAEEIKSYVPIQNANTKIKKPC